MRALKHHALLLHQKGVAESIYDALVAWWDFEENDANPTFIDSHGANDLTIRTGASTTASSAVSSTTHAKSGRRFLSNGSSNPNRTAYIPRSNTALDLPDSDWSFGGWFEGLNLGGWSAFVMGRLGSASGSYQAQLVIESTLGRLVFQVSADGSTAVTANSGTGISSSGSMTFVVGTLDRANNLIRVRVNKSANVTAAFPSALYTGASAANFCIIDAMSSDGTFFSGSRELLGSDSGAEACFYASKALTDAEYDYLYNSGAGINYATLAAAAGH